MGICVVVKNERCVVCGASVNWICGPVEWSVKDERIVVDAVEHGICTQCGETYFDCDMADDIHRRAVDAYKSEHGLLSGSEIKTLRQGLGLSQAQFEKLIGAGPKTVIRWENGSVFQNKTADTLLRILRDYPQVAEDLMDKRLA